MREDISGHNCYAAVRPHGGKGSNLFDINRQQQGQKRLSMIQIHLLSMPVQSNRAQITEPPQQQEKQLGAKSEFLKGGTERLGMQSSSEMSL